MAKFSGTVGYNLGTVETEPGVWEEQIVERKHRGDVIQNIRRLDQGDKINGDIRVQNSISLVADAFANNHFFAIRYVDWMGAKWIVTSVEVQRPRLILHLGGVYNADDV